MKGLYPEEFYIVRYTESQDFDWILGGFVTEKIHRADSALDGATFSNEYIFLILKDLGYIPVLGDLIYYDYTNSGLDSNEYGQYGKALVVKGIEYRATERFFSVIATFKDFVSSDYTIASFNNNIRRRTYDLVNVSDGHIIHHLESNTITLRPILLMAHFYHPDGTEETSINYTRIDNNTIKLVMFPGATFTGTVTIERR